MATSDYELKSEITIEPERADSEVAVKLIQELEDILGPMYPDESRHGYDVEKMLREGVHFFVLRVDDRPAACGGVQYFAAEDGQPPYGELKRMYVRPDFRRRGLAKRILEHLSQHAEANDVHTLRLETGVHQLDAIGLYESWGFYRIGHFGPYTDDPLSVYFEKTI